MKRLETENHNTKEYYNIALIDHLKEAGIDYDDMWRIETLLSEYRGGNLLDIGCGISPVCLVAKGRYPWAEVYGIDFADELIDKQKSSYKTINYSVGDFYTLPFDDEFFSYVVLGEVLEHSERPKEVIAEAMRVLKKRGILAVSVPNNETNDNHYYQQHIWSFGEEDMRDMFENPTVKILNNNIIVHVTKS